MSEAVWVIALRASDRTAASTGFRPGAYGGGRTAVSAGSGTCGPSAKRCREESRCHFPLGAGGWRANSEVTMKQITGNR